MASSVVKKSRVKPVKAGHLAVTELASPFAASSSPFGDDVQFPLPVESLNWTYSPPVPTRTESYAGGH
ncbi:hypothetical protein Afil01_54310 [Actinorhabdospora filicis]|uniref:Uncharacterized protein n=1 Tax=Actinorhabdospora filicis TaxID=1785913 RepID=A0A9W6SPJ2_9ACTN|nr:hypothetical protein [Actinorhabdospora filicis]GLZ80624.1 hypothetical protein Afil01_54310 [Actinorhabdospora filicis]